MIDLSFQIAPGSMKASIAGLNTQTSVEQNNLDHLFTLPDFVMEETFNTDKRGWWILRKITIL